MFKIAARFTLGIALLAFAFHAEARPARSGDVSVSITLREDVAALAWINATNPTAQSAAEMHDLIALFDDAGIEEGRAFIGKIKPDKLKAFTLEQVPATATVRNLSKGEAELFVSILSPSKAHPQDVATGRLLSALADKITKAIGTK